MVTNSAVAFLVREGNPKKIYGWGDLTRKGVQVITANPFTSGGARWNVIAGYGAKRRQGASHAQAVAYLLNLFKHVVSQDTSARNALTTFAQGKGDVLLSYENEAIFAEKNGVPSEYVLPKRTITIELPIALTKTGQNDPGAKAFLNFLRTDQAQQIWADNGYRPVVKRVFAKNKAKFPVPQGIFNIRRSSGSAAGRQSRSASSIPTRGSWSASKRPSGASEPDCTRDIRAP